ncbi:MAG TPA: hypothetical protein VHG27_07690 [Xanthobacteraceae bacterium]|nr:hypothetical protein [Xanthobacteraceae bacterium]
MCLMCERDEMLAAYREYLARRETAAKAAAEANAFGRKTASPDDDDAWAKGTWFAADKTSGA